MSKLFVVLCILHHTCSIGAAIRLNSDHYFIDCYAVCNTAMLGAYACNLGSVRKATGMMPCQLSLGGDGSIALANSIALLVDITTSHNRIA